MKSMIVSVMMLTAAMFIATPASAECEDVGGLMVAEHCTDQYDYTYGECGSGPYGYEYHYSSETLTVGDLTVRLDSYNSCQHNEGYYACDSSSDRVYVTHATEESYDYAYVNVGNGGCEYDENYYPQGTYRDCYVQVYHYGADHAGNHYERLAC